VIESVPRPEWSPLPFEGCDGVDGKVLLDEPSVGVALLRFAPGGTIHEHPGETDAYVVGLDGRGWTSVGGERAELRAGEKAFWPRGVPHRLWAEDAELLALLVHPLGFTAP
jgi:quercetin dioxygenase-like cupin family protein